MGVERSSIGDSGNRYLVSMNNGSFPLMTISIIETWWFISMHSVEPTSDGVCSKPFETCHADQITTSAKDKHKLNSTPARKQQRGV